MHRLLCHKNVTAVFQLRGKLREDRPQPPFAAVSYDSISNFLACRETYPFNSLFGKKKENAGACMSTFPAPVDNLKLFIELQRLEIAYTVNFLLPLARRALMILRPFLVAIRVLKP